LICDCWLITGKVEEEHPFLRHLLLKTEQPKRDEETVLLCGVPRLRSDGTERSAIYYDLTKGYDVKLCRLCEVEIQSGRVKVEDVC
jgi:hypothetical protein